MGDFQANFHRPDTGIRTVEGNLAGNRAATLEKKRQQDQEMFEQRKKQIILESGNKDEHGNIKSQSIQSKFSGSSIHDKVFQSKTIGLVTIDEFKRVQQQQLNGAVDDDDDDDEETKLKKLQILQKEIAIKEKAAKIAKKKKLKEKKKMLSTLSFAGDEEEEDDDNEIDDNDKASNNKSKSKQSTKNSIDDGNNNTTVTKIVCSTMKDPTVDTSFLPDIQRDVQIQEERIRLEKQWKLNQIQIKQEQLEIIYSYWDGSGHRRSCICTKGNTIGEFLQLVQQQLSSEFREISKLSSDNLLYIKEDLIIPYDITFYDLIVTKARGKSGPLFHFDVHDDIRVGTIDVRIEKDESHPGKVVDRRWYERNKHIFPASRWEYYNPLKDYGTYKIGGTSST